MTGGSDERRGGGADTKSYDPHPASGGSNPGRSTERQEGAGRADDQRTPRTATPPQTGSDWPFT